MQVDILGLGYDMFMAMPENERAVLLYRARSVSGVKTREDAVARMFQYVHMRALGNMLTNLPDVNRRFSRILRKYGTSISEAIEDGLLKQHLKEVITDRGSYLLFSYPVYVERTLEKDKYEFEDMLVKNYLNSRGIVQGLKND